LHRFLPADGFGEKMKFLKVLTFLVCLAVGGPALAQKNNPCGQGGNGALKSDMPCDGQGGNGIDDHVVGGFVSTTGKIVLKEEGLALAKLIKEYSSDKAIELYFAKYMGGVPKNFNRQDMIDTFANRMKDQINKTKKDRLYGDRFLWHETKFGQHYIVGLKPYYYSLVGYTPTAIGTDQVTSHLQSLLHEYSHFWGYNDEQGSKFGESFLEFLLDDGVNCRKDSSSYFYLSFNGGPFGVSNMLYGARLSQYLSSTVTPYVDLPKPMWIPAEISSPSEGEYKGNANGYAFEIKFDPSLTSAAATVQNPDGTSITFTNCTYGGLDKK
jgi:hypothetical protein